VNVETKEQSFQWMHTHSPNKPKKLNDIVCQKADGSCFLMVVFMQQGTMVASEMHSKTLKNCVGAFRKKGVDDIQCTCSAPP
jgi:hypothetical protein